MCNTRPLPPLCIGTADSQITPLTRYLSQQSPLWPLTSLDCILTWQEQCQLAEGSGAESQLGVGPGAWPWAAPCPGSRKGSDPPPLGAENGGPAHSGWITQATILPAASGTTREPLGAAWPHRFILVPFDPAPFFPPGLLTTFFLAPLALTSRLSLEKMLHGSQEQCLPPRLQF